MSLPIKQLLKTNLKKYYALNNSKRFIKNFTKVKPKYNEEFLNSPQNLIEIERNVNKRKGIGKIKVIHELLKKLNNSELCIEERSDLEKIIQIEYGKIPNNTHPEVLAYGEEPKVIKIFNKESTEYGDYSPKEFSEICKRLNILRTEHLGNFNGHKSYYLLSDLADLEQALIQYTMEHLFSKGFQLVSVPDILPEGVIESCGMATTGERTQVYRILPSNLCLSGTSEMALAGLFSGKTVKLSDMPIKLTAVSRCFRAETSGKQEEKGIYRVHQFTKVEMFSVCHPDQSTEILEEFKAIEIELFNNLGLHFKLLDMPPCELGAPAYRKYDIEAWLPGRKMWGEVSSCSNCTDYQSRRLGVTLKNSNQILFPHTVNGTACAIPRMLIAIVETFQNSDHSIQIPEVLLKYMPRDKIVRLKNLPELKLIKNILKEKPFED